MTISDGKVLSGPRLTFLGIAWLLAGLIMFVVTLMEVPNRGGSTGVLVAILGLLQLSFLLEPKGTPGRVQVSVGGALLLVMGLLLLNMGAITSMVLVRLFISLWVVLVLVYNAFAIGNLDAQADGRVAKTAAVIAGVLAIAVAFVLFDDLILGLVAAGYFIAIGTSISLIARAG